MNLGAHIAVASGLQRHQPTPGPADNGPSDQGAEPGSQATDKAAELLGSALPDLAAMGRFRLLGRSTHAGVNAGIQLHYRTDELFHRHPWFRQRHQALMADLAGGGFSRGPAMACSHVGIELLLDGSLLRRPAVAAANRAALAVIPAVRARLVDLVEAAHQVRWLDHVDRLAGRDAPPDLDDPTAVARRLRRILSARPRLAFAVEQEASLAAVLARHQPSIDGTGVDLVDEIVHCLVTEQAGDGFDAPWALSSTV